MRQPGKFRRRHASGRAPVRSPALRGWSPLPAGQLARAGLVDRVDQHVGDDHVRRPAGDPGDDVGDVARLQRGHPVVDGVRGRLVAVEADEGELGLHHARVDLADPDATAQHVHAHATGDPLDSGLGRAVHGPAGVDLAPGVGTDVDDVAGAALDHAREDAARDVEEAPHVGVQHPVPVVGIVGLDGAAPGGQPGVVDEDVDRRPLRRQCAQCGRHLGPVPDVHRHR
jgi:hypothetical protein